MSVLVLARTIIFLPSSSYGTVFWILDESNAGNTQLLLLGSAHLHPSCQLRGWGCTRSWEGRAPEQLAHTGHWAILCHVASC